MLLIETAYRKTWNNLKELFEDEVKDHDYAEKLTKKLYPILDSFINEVNTENFQIGRAIIQFNSLKTHSRIRVPVIGEKNEKEPWKETQKKWEKKFFISESKDKKGDDKKLMYLQPDEPNHLLTELMWRFQGENSLDILAFVVEKESESKLFLAKGDETLKYVTLSEKCFYEVEETKKLTTQLNQQKSKNPFVRLPKEKYSIDDCKRIFQGTYDILYGKKEPYLKNPPQNIIYVSDFTDTDYLGSFNFELKGNTEDIELSELKSFIRKIRWFLSRFIIEIISKAERNYVSSGGIYKDVYFTKTDDQKYNGLNGLKSCLSPTSIVKDSTSRKVLEKVQNHFHIADSTYGEYWKGYKRHAYEVACTVAGIIDILFLNNLTDIGAFEKFIRQQGPRLDRLNDEFVQSEEKTIKDLPFLFKQLFRGLEREKEFFLLPEYRDHFIHSFYCFSFGLLIMNNKIPDITLDSLNINDKKLLQKWFITAMWHDIAYILEKGNNIIEKYILNFLQTKKYKNVLPWIPSLGSLMQIENLLDEVKDLSQNALIIPINKIKNKKNIDERDIILAIAFEDINHGIWSSYFVHHCLCDNNDFETLALEKEDVKHICRAIMSHHISDWKVDDKIKSDFNIEGNYNNWANARINLKENDLGYLLCLCDTICQAGREAPEMTELQDKERMSKLNIKYNNIMFNKEEKSLKVSLSYDKIVKEESKKEKDSTIYKFFEKPFSFLNLSPQKIEKDAIIIEITDGTNTDEKKFKHK